jgi:hypothetical protein
MAKPFFKEFPSIKEYFDCLKNTDKYGDNYNGYKEKAWCKPHQYLNLSFKNIKCSCKYIKLTIPK